MLKQYIEYVKDNPKGYWFKRKLYGWGWTPATWQGWLVIVVYLIAIIAFSLTIDETSPPEEVMFTFVLPIVLLTATVIRLGYTKGEKPRWQWGLPNNKNPS